MALDDDDDVGPPLPPDDRLWRHPSELRQHGRAGGTVVPTPAAQSYRPRISTVALVAGLAGGALATAAIALSGLLPQQGGGRDEIEQVAITPVVSSPEVGGTAQMVSLAERVSPAIVRLDVESPNRSATGSGVLFRDDGLLLTSARIVSEATSIRVVLTDGRQLEGHLLGLDPATDIALVDLAGRGFPVAVLGTSEGLELGTPTVAVGSSSTLAGSDALAAGVISAMDSRVEVADGQPLHGMIQTDAPITPGSAGGALVDATGKVIGITTVAASEPGGRFGFATPIDLAQRVALQLLATGHMAHGWLGVEGADLTVEQAQAMGVEGGALVLRVASDSPASAAGLSVEDVITEVDGQRVSSVSELVVQLRSHDPGDEIAVGYWRRGRHAQAMVTLTERP